MIRLSVFGTLRVDDDRGGDLSELAVQPRILALLVYLAVARPSGRHQRDRVVGMLWPELDQERARGALRRALHRLRAVIGEDTVISSGTDLLALQPNAVWCDATEFQHAIAGERLREAVDLYKGELLPGFYVPDAEAFMRWLDDERAYCRDQALAAAWGLVVHYESDQQFTSATQLARVVARLAPTDERILRRVLLLLDRHGDRAGVADLYKRFVDRLWDEYEMRPSPETIRLFETIQRAEQPSRG